jgi:hypothetical protein
MHRFFYRVLFTILRNIALIINILYDTLNNVNITINILIYKNQAQFILKRYYNSHIISFLKLSLTQDASYCIMQYFSKWRRGQFLSLGYTEDNCPAANKINLVTIESACGQAITFC